MRNHHPWLVLALTFIAASAFGETGIPARCAKATPAATDCACIADLVKYNACVLTAARANTQRATPKCEAIADLPAYNKCVMNLARANAANAGSCDRFKDLVAYTACVFSEATRAH